MKYFNFKSFQFNLLKSAKLVKLFILKLATIKQIWL